MKLVGVQAYAFTPNNSQTEYTGYNLYTVEEISKDKGLGLRTGKLAISTQTVQSLNLDLNAMLGKNIKVSYNQWRKVQSVEVD